MGSSYFIQKPPFSVSSEIFIQYIHAASVRDNWQATTRLASHSKLTIPTQSKTLAWAKISTDTSRQQCHSLVEPLGENGGVEVASALVTVGSGWVPLSVRNVQCYAVDLGRLQSLATVTSVDPGSVGENRELSLVEVSPGVVEVSLIDQSHWRQLAKMLVLPLRPPV